MESSRKKRKREWNRKMNRRKNSSRNPNRDIDVFLRDTFYSVIPNKQEKINRKQLLEKVRNVLKTEFNGSEVYVYGSYASGTSLRRSDIDFGLKFKTKKALATIRRVADILEDNGIKRVKLSSFDIPAPGRDVFVYFATGRDEISEIKVDLSLNNPVAPFASTFVKAVVDHHFTEKILLVLIKHFATRHRLNVNGGLCNIGHSYLGILILQKNNVIPEFLSKEQITSIDDLVQESNNFNIASQKFIKPLGITTAASLLLDYFKFYSQDVDFVEMAISVRGGCLVTKESLGWPKKEEGYHLAIVDPFSGDNKGRTVTIRGLNRIRGAFKHARRILEDGGELETLFQPFNSYV